MPSHRGFSAWIVVDGKPLPEYLVAFDSSANRVSCWIPSEEGKNFSVYWKDHGGKVDTCGYIMLDGYMAPGRFLYGEGMAFRSGMRSGPASERPFVFQKVDEDSVFDSTLAMEKDVGSIVLRIKRVKLTAVTAPNPIQQPPGIHMGKNGVRIGFGAEQPSYEQYPSTWKVEPYDNPGQRKPNTYVSFVFRYRSPDFLRSQGIMEGASSLPEFLLGKQSQRRIASMPTPTPPISLTPSLNPTTTEGSFADPVYYRLGSHRLNQPAADYRRVVSLQAYTEVEEVEPVNYPGEGLLIFPFQKSTVNQSRGGGEPETASLTRPST